MEQLVVILVLAVIAFLNWLVQRIQRRSGGDILDGGKTPGTQRQRGELRRKIEPRRHETEAERMRRFMEALGIPVGSPPIERAEPAAPPPVPKQTPPVPEPEYRQIEQRRKRAQEAARRVVAAVPEPPVAPPAPLIEPSVPPAYVHVLAPLDPVAATRASAPGMDALRVMLRSKDHIRSAVLLREILGPPRGLEPSPDLPGWR